MSQSTTPSISISISPDDCQKLIFILEKYVHDRDENWKKWADEINEIIRKSVAAGAGNSPTIVLKQVNWDTIDRAIQETCQSLDDDWQQWASSIGNKIPKSGLTEADHIKINDYYSKGWKSFWDGYQEGDEGISRGHHSKAHGYLVMAYKAAGNNLEAKKGIAGLIGLNLAYMEDYKNAEVWVNAELSINPTSVSAKLAQYPIAVSKLVGHKGFVARSDGSGFGIAASILTTGVDVGRVQSKRSAVRTAAIEAAKTIEYRARTDEDPDPSMWILWTYLLLTIINNMWVNDMRDSYLCQVILNLPWHRFTDEQMDQDVKVTIEELNIDAQGYLGRIK